MLPTVGEDQDALHAAVSYLRSAKIRTLFMDAAHFRRTLADLGLSQTEAAKLLGLSRWKVVRYAGGKPIPPPVAILLNLLVGGAVTRDDVGAVPR
jgi:hypothetical protein